MGFDSSVPVAMRWWSSVLRCLVISLLTSCHCSESRYPVGGGLIGEPRFCCSVLLDQHPTAALTSKIGLAQFEQFMKKGWWTMTKR